MYLNDNHPTTTIPKTQQTSVMGLLKNDLFMEK